MNTHLLFNFATRSRPHKFKAAIDNIVSMCRTNEYTILVKADTDDNTMNNREMIDWMAKIPQIVVAWGLSESKIHAINRDIDKVQVWDILINMSDDMYFLVPGFDFRIIELFKHHNSTDIFLHLPDGHTGDAISTLSIIGRDYYARDGYVYVPAYKSLFCDNEATEMAKNRGCYKWHNEKLYEHRHPANGWGQGDAQLRRTESHFYTDQAIYEKRKSLGFPKTSVL